MNKWFVVHTQPQKELLAEQQLKNQGFAVFLPRYKKLRRHARKMDTVIQPLFPRYLFVEFDPEVKQWFCVNHTRGVSYLLVSNEVPIALPQDTIDSLIVQQDEEGLVTLDSLALLFTKGDKVSILQGAFKGQVATFEKFDGMQRVQLLLDFLGRQQRIFLPTHEVEKL